MKHARPPLDREALEESHALLTTTEIARLLRVHPKHVYRLLRRGLPGRRVGGEWRFNASEVLRWSGGSMHEPRVTEDSVPSLRPAETSPLLAANGDVVIERLLARLTAAGRPIFGHVLADRDGGLDLIRRGQVLLAGCHGGELPGMLEGERLAFVHLADRQVVLAFRRGVRLTSVSQLGRWRLAGRPPTAGVRELFGRELRRHSVDPDALHARALLLPSHREVVCAVARGEADVGLTSRAWADTVGLESISLFEEGYGLLVRASLLGDARVIRLCEIAQSSDFRREVASIRGYEARLTGTVSYEPSGVLARGAKPVSHRSYKGRPS